MDARAEYVIRIPAAALHPRRRSREGARPAPVARALRDVLAVLSAEPPLLPPGKFTLYVRAGGAYHRIGVEVPDLVKGPRAAPPAPEGAGGGADVEDASRLPDGPGGWGGMRRVADGLWEIIPYLPDVDGW